jgi:thiosulfate/3-mercaptopyruvate sulfurtransferase
MYSTLISPKALHAALPSIRVIDCRFELAVANAKSDAGQKAYENAHIPRALYAHLDADLSGAITPMTGRHPLPDPKALAATFGRWGINAQTQVVAYDADTGMFAARLWWLLRWMGHSKVAVLDGGFKAWQTEGLPCESALPVFETASFVGKPDTNCVITAAALGELRRRNDWRVLDARAPERFRGEVEPLDPVAGHIPGARNHPFAWNMGPDGLLPADDLKRKYEQSLQGVATDHAIMMCGSGVTACHNLLAMEVAGLRGAKLYAGSWSEWIRDPTRPIAQGE